MQYETVKQQCNAFKEIGFFVSFQFQDKDKYGEPKIYLLFKNKSWRFCDPDWNVIIFQLANLYLTKIKSH